MHNNHVLKIIILEGSPGDRLKSSSSMHEHEKEHCLSTEDML